MQKMNAPLQYRLDHADLALVLALVRGGSLARAAELLRVDVSTVFRAIRRLEKNLGKALFDKSRSGYLANQTARRLAQQAELAEQALEAARIGLELEREVLSGTVRMTCSDAVLHGLLLPALARFMPGYPALQLELATSNDFANLSRRDADIALRMTRTPPEHLVGRNLGEVRYVLCASERYLEGRDATEPAMLHWIAPDDFLPNHPSVVWRRRHYPGGAAGLPLQRRAGGRRDGPRRPRPGGDPCLPATRRRRPAGTGRRPRGLRQRPVAADPSGLPGVALGGRVVRRAGAACAIGR